MHDQFAPIFIVGPERSGTTLMAVLLDRHSQIAITPETQFMIDHQKCHRPGSHWDQESIRSVLESVGRLRDLDVSADDIAVRAARYSSDAVSLFRCILESHAAKCGKPCCGEKSPSHVNYVSEILEWYPNARVLCMIRDGRDVVLSLLQMPWTHNNLRAHCAAWIRAARQVRMWADRFTDNVHVVRFESLVTSPEAQLESVMEFLGLPREEAQMTEGKSAVVPGWEMNWKGKALAAIDHSRRSAWRRNATPRQRDLMTRIMAHELKEFEYEDDDAAAQPAIVFGKCLQDGCGSVTSAIEVAAWRIKSRVRQTFVGQGTS